MSNTAHVPNQCDNLAGDFVLIWEMHILGISQAQMAYGREGGLVRDANNSAFRWLSPTNCSDRLSKFKIL